MDVPRQVTAGAKACESIATSGTRHSVGLSSGREEEGTRGKMGPGEWKGQDQKGTNRLANKLELNSGKSQKSF